MDEMKKTRFQGLVPSDDVEAARARTRREAAYKAMDGLGLLREDEHSDAYEGVKYLILDALGRAEDAKLA